MKTCVIIPAYKVKAQICSVIAQIPDEITAIYVVDDCCPEHSGQFVESECEDDRLEVIIHEHNLGVGGALKTGYQHALKNRMDVCVKVDGDGQMNPDLIPVFLHPIISSQADYTKGNRFHRIESLQSMPLVRKIGNACLSLINKFTSGYWNVMDPTNGFTAIHRTALESLPLDKINDRYFFESDMLFRLGTIRAVVKDIPMDAVYGDENSSLKIGHTITQFIPLYFKAFWKRLFYTYFLRDFNAASLETVVGSLLFMFGVVFGTTSWIESASEQQFASTGTVMLSVVPLIMGFQLLLSALHFDIENVPKEPLQSSHNQFALPPLKP